MNDAIDNPALFLTYRRFFPIAPREFVTVTDEREIEEHLKGAMQRLPASSGILLSGGIDSAILARFMPEGSTAYTLDYLDASKKSEFREAARFVRRGVRHRQVFVNRSQYFQAAEELVRLKRMPLVPHEAAIAVACQQALQDGVTHLVGGFGADTGFGGFGDYYQNRRWEDFAANILPKYWNARSVLKECGDVSWVARQYVHDETVDVQRMLKEVGTEGNAVVTTIQALGMTPVHPFATMRFGRPFDVTRIISGDTKYLLKALFGRIYPDQAPARKFALHVPYNRWMMGYQPSRPEFKETLRLSPNEGKRSALIFSLERYFIHKEQGWTASASPAGFPLKNRAARSIHSMMRAFKRGMRTLAGGGSHSTKSSGNNSGES